MRHFKVPLILMSLVLAGCAGSSSSVSQDMYLTSKGFQELQKGNYRQAEANFDVALDINPNNPYALLNLGVVYQNTGRLERAREMYQKVIDLNPTDRAGESTRQDLQGKSLAEIARKNLKTLESKKQ